MDPDQLAPMPGDEISAAGARDPEEADHDPQPRPRIGKPISPASAILYPDRQVTVRGKQVEKPAPQSDHARTSSVSRFQDVWASECDICAYCATEISLDDNRCPGCKRKLVKSQFRYKRTSPEHTIYWVLLLGIGQIIFIRLILDLILREPLILIAWHGFLFTLMIVLAVGIFLRQFWAYAASIVIMLLMLSGLLLTMTADPAENTESATAEVERAIQDNLLIAIADTPYETLAIGVYALIDPLQLIAVILVLLYGLLKVGPEFERVRTHHLASIDKGLEGSSHYYAVGQSYAEKDQWATAILHWQRAAALEPSRLVYHRTLGLGYAKLGFYNRALDVLESAAEQTRESSVREDFLRLAYQVKAERSRNLSEPK